MKKFRLFFGVLLSMLLIVNLCACGASQNTAELNVPKYEQNGDGCGESSFLGTEYESGQIVSVTFCSSLKGAPDDAVDVSANQNNSVLLWGTECDYTDEKTDYEHYYDITIASDGKIVCPEDISYMFAWCVNVLQISFNDCLDTSNVTDMSGMFDGCLKLTSLDLSSFDTSNVINMGVMFSACYQLENVDLSSFNTTKVEHMACMFQGCSFTSVDVSSFDTSNVVNMSSMFGHCSKLQRLDLSNFNTAKVEDMQGMFQGCKSLTQLDTSNFVIGPDTKTKDMYKDVPGYID